MGGLSHAFWLWVPVLIYKFVSAVLRTFWKFNLWILQTLSGIPLYYCRPEFRIPAIFLGTFGNICSFNFIMFLFIAIGSAGNKATQQTGQPVGTFLLMGLFGTGLLLACRFLIRRGST